ncbi:hypothetical protein SBI67_14810 [Mycolicibacterium sp. 120266]|uniref:hypothetical protein n=1 Tax=Mycolicibacterium sp. 120266 TaxID=3090601 RepID=UPI00299F2438|nr:hypothetical protein [Mycolicibacterium sp. 120266]MDX1873390.1 hypothetical protein [Mycolicibacterium sp. 120266]
MFDRQIYRDPPVALTQAQLWAAERAAERAARAARRSLRTARSQYRRYRSKAAETYLDWPRWHAAYLREYRKSGALGGGTNDSFSSYGGGYLLS